MLQRYRRLEEPVTWPLAWWESNQRAGVSPDLNSEWALLVLVGCSLRGDSQLNNLRRKRFAMSMAVELRQAGSEQVLHRLMLEDVPQPGRWLEVEGLSYLVLQRRHRYRLRGGRYQLSGVALW